MESSPNEASSDQLRLTFDGEVFDVRYDPSQPGAYHYTRLTGPAPGYAFTSRRSDHGKSSAAEHVDGQRPDPPLSARKCHWADTSALRGRLPPSARAAAADSPRR